MKPTEILNSVKELLNLSTESVKEEVKEVVLAEEEEIVVPEEAVVEVEDESVKMDYVTSEDLMAVKAELLSMIKALIEDKPMGEAEEVPEELSSQKEVELSEEAVEVVHSPENSIETKKSLLSNQNQSMTTEQRVHRMLFNN